MKIQVSQNFDPESWDKFVSQSNNGTIFHTCKFLNYHPRDRFPFVNLIFHKGSRIVAALPGGLKGSSYISPLGASFGSLVTNVDTLSDYEILVDSLMEFLKDKQINEIFLTPPPLPYLKSMNELERYVLSYKGFEVKQELISSIIDLNLYTEKSLLSNQKKRFRYDVKKSLSLGLTVRTADREKEYKDFYKMLEENKKRLDSRPTHSYEELEEISKTFKDKVKLFLCYKGSQLIAGIWLILCNDRTALTFYIAHYYKYHENHGVSRLLYEIITWLVKIGYSWLDLGVSMDTKSKNSEEPSRSLIFFKESLNAKAFVRTTYHKII